MPMTNEFLAYFQSMGLNAAFRPRIEQTIEFFESRANQWMPGAACENVLVMPVKDVMGNAAFELTLFGADAIMYAGVLYLKPPIELSLNIKSVHKRVQYVKMRGRNCDPILPDNPVSDGGELFVEFQLTGEPKKDEYWAKGVGCRQLQEIVARHILSNMV